jgi:hypothetical protein
VVHADESQGQRLGRDDGGCAEMDLRQTRISTQ